MNCLKPLILSYLLLASMPGPLAGSPIIAYSLDESPEYGASAPIRGTLPWHRLFNVVDGSVDGSHDIQGKFQIGWTQESLYFRIQINDQLIVDNSDWLLTSNFWNGDMLELFIDFNGDAQSSYDGEFDYHIIVPRDGSQGWIHEKSAPVGRLSYSDMAVSISFNNTSGTQEIEVAIPWGPTGIDPATGDKIGFDVFVKDNDGMSVRDAQIAWNCTMDTAWKNPSGFGKVILGSDPPEETVLIHDGFDDENRFDGQLPTEARVIQTGRDLAGLNTKIAFNDIVGSNALEVANGGQGSAGQFVGIPFPEVSFEEVGDQLILDLSVAFRAGTQIVRDRAFKIGIINQKDDVVIPKDIAGDLGYIPARAMTQWANYHVAIGTGGNTSSAALKRLSFPDPIDADSTGYHAWWQKSVDLAEVNANLFPTDTIVSNFNIRLKLVYTAENQIGVFFYPRVDSTQPMLVGYDDSPSTYSFDLIGFRYDWKHSVDEVIPEFALDSIKLTHVRRGELPKFNVSFSKISSRGEAPTEPNTNLSKSAVSEIINSDIFNARPLSSESQPEHGKSFYVATWGDSAGDGSFEKPLSSIQMAVDMAQPGDSVIVRGGVYRESVVFSNSGSKEAPITVRAYHENGRFEKVTLSAMDTLTPGQNGIGEWDIHQNDIWKIHIPPSALDYGTEPKFYAMLKDEGLIPARHPNTANYWTAHRDDMMRSVNTFVNLDENKAAYYNHLLEGYPDGIWRGAKMWFYPGYNWFFTNRMVDESSSDGSVTFFAKGGIFTPADDDPFMLHDALPALDEAGEYFYDQTATNGWGGEQFTFYVWMPDSQSPVDAGLSYRAREYGFYSESASHISIVNIDVVGGKIWFGYDSHHILIDGMDILHGGFDNTFWNFESSVAFYGDHATFQNGSTLFSRCHFGGIANYGEHGKITNNVVGYSPWVNVNTHLGDPEKTKHLQFGTKYVTAAYNTIFMSQGANVNIGAYDSKYVMNHVYTGGIAGVDIANMNAHGGGDLGGTLVAYNWVHGAYGTLSSKPGHNGGFGIRSDAGIGSGGTANFRIYRNVVWDVTLHDISSWAQVLEDQPLYGNTQNYIYHNTVEDEIAIAPNNRGDASETYVRNNIALGSYLPAYNLSDPDVVNEYNVYGTGSWGPTNHIGDALVIDFENRNFTLHHESPAIDHGMFLPDYIGLDDYNGEYPDSGAYEFGVEPWYPGARIRWDDLHCLRLMVNEKGLITVAGFPLGRKPTTDFVVRIGAEGSVYKVDFSYDTDSHSSEVSLVDANPTLLDEYADVYFSLNGSDFVRAD